MKEKLRTTNLNMLSMYDEGIKRGQDKTFIIFQRVDGKREEYSFNYILKQADKLIVKMKEAGLKKGDRVAVVSALRPCWYALHYACLRAGYIMACIDPGVPQSQIQKLMVQAQARAVFTTLPVIHLPQELDKHVPVFSIEEDFPITSKCKKVDFLLEDSHKLPQDTFYILFSSGTTGENRKAVLLNTATVTTAIEYGMSNDSGVYRNKPAYRIVKKDLMLFPPYHIAGLLCATYDIYLNAQVIILERLTPNGLVSVLQELQPDNICTVPAMLTSLYKKIIASYKKKMLVKTSVNTLLKISGFLRKNLGINAGRVLLKPINKQAFGGNMKSFMIGASPMDKETSRFFLDMGIDVIMAYGLTELGAPLATTGMGYYPGTTGRVLRHTNDIDIRIVNKDESGRGEVEVKSPYRMISYLFKKDNEGCYTPDGYFKTGDLGYFDNKQCLTICGRVKESIVLRNGEKLLPEEIESKYQNLLNVIEVVAFKVPGEGGCDDFSIAITKDKKVGIPDDAMKVRVYERAEKLPPMYRPKDVYVLKEFPLSSTHKVQRFRLTEMAEAGLDEPITDASLIPVDEDETTAELRKILVQVGGSRWKTEKLTQGLLLNLDSLTIVNLYVAIQDKWQIDLFQSISQPETFGELLDIVKNFDNVDKTTSNLDLSQFPLPASKFNKSLFKNAEKLLNSVYRLKSYGIENLPKDTNFLICPNHRTDIDPGFICGSLPDDVRSNLCIVGRYDLVENKFLKYVAISHNFVPVDRTGNSIQTLDRCKELLLEGRDILIFPEGTSVNNHTDLFELKQGPARLSIATQKPIIPTRIMGVAHTDKEMSGFGLPPIKSKIVVKFGKPIYPKDMTPQQLNEVLSKAIQEIE